MDRTVFLICCLTLTESIHQCKKIYKSAIRAAKKTTNEHITYSSENKVKSAWQVVRTLTDCSFHSLITLSLEEFTTFYGGMVEELRQRIPPTAASVEAFLSQEPRLNNRLRWKSVTPD
ncbi:hypothetical protein J6590_065789 [Homalodisca vitripennis]|nr:hypothetical protein J6590_065789 [Homalodisca vitripennis]